MGRRIPLWQCLMALLFAIICLMYCLGIFGKLFGSGWECDYGEVHIALIASAIVAGVIARANGYKWSFLEAGILASINRSMQAMLILMTVGLLIGSWIAAGVVPAMIYYGLSILSPGIFLIAACILCCIVSLATGSSWTTVGTIGIALIGIGYGLGISSAMTAGAIVSGAYFGDKMSPLSDTTNLAPAMAGATLFDHIKHMMYTVTPSLIIALLLYGILGMGHSGADVDMSVVTEMRNGLSSAFNLNVWLLIPPIVVIIIVLLKLPALPGLMGGIVIGCVFGSIFQGISLAEWPGILHYGYTYVTSDSFATAVANIDPVLFDKVTGAGGDFASTFSQVRTDDVLGLDSDVFENLAEAIGMSTADSMNYNLSQLLSRGGMSSMLWTINLIICAMCFGGIMDASGMLGTIAEKLLKVAKNTGMLVLITVISCIVMNIIAGDQYLSIVLPGRMYKEAYEDRRLAPKCLSRALEDSGTITSNLVPWNTCGATMSTFLGVAQWGPGGYAKYAFLNLVNPLISVIYGFTGITMTKMTEEEYQKVLERREADKAAALASLEG